MGYQQNLLKHLAICLVALFFLNSCQDDDTPVPRFIINYQSPFESNDLYRGKRPTYVPLKFRNVSLDADTYKWDFGEGSTSTEKDPIFTYKKSGLYTVTLTATNQAGRQQVSSQSVRIVDRVLKQVIIENLNWNAMGNLPNWPATKTAAVQLVIEQRVSSAMNIPLFESALIPNVSTTKPVTIPVTSRIVVDPVENFNILQANLFGYDSAGKVLVFAGGGFVTYYTQGERGLFVLITSFGGTTLRFECTYE